DANPGRPMGIVGAPLDQSLQGSYWLWRRGLVLQVEPEGKKVFLDELAAETERLLQQYRPPNKRSIRAKSFESALFADYPLPAVKVGEEYDKAGMYPQAQGWYERALDVDPDLPQ